MGETENTLLLKRRKSVLGSAYRLFYDEPLHVVSGEGVWLIDSAGERYLDMYNNVPHVGHCHPHVVDAIATQAATLNTHTRYLHQGVVDYAERLLATFPGELDTVMFCCTGSEANELALRIARAATQAQGVVVTDFAYHGNTQAIFEISSEDCRSLPPHVATIAEPDTFRGAHTGEDAGPRYAAQVFDAVARLDEHGIRPAAFVVDTIMSSGGVVKPPAGFLSACAANIREVGGLFIADEVQPGFGRTGDTFWGFESDGVIPDIVTMGKPMGNGHPVSAVVLRGELLESFHDGYFNTFGGNPVSIAAASAVLDVIERESLQQNAKTVGAFLREGLEHIAHRHAVIGDVRGNGLFAVAEFVDADGQPDAQLTHSVVNDLRRRGILTSRIGRDSNILKLRPPMVIAKGEAQLFLSALDDVLSQ
ncbi:MAG: aminotransferase class III-fold pyridoxal phosphate-dependent enzyme [Pseudomonadota bacterium]